MNPVASPPRARSRCAPSRASSRSRPGRIRRVVRGRDGHVELPDHRIEDVVGGLRVPGVSRLIRAVDVHRGRRRTNSWRPRPRRRSRRRRARHDKEPFVSARVASTGGGAGDALAAEGHLQVERAHCWGRDVGHRVRAVSVILNGRFGYPDRRTRRVGNDARDDVVAADVASIPRTASSDVTTKSPVAPASTVWTPPPTAADLSARDRERTNADRCGSPRRPRRW